MNLNKNTIQKILDVDFSNYDSAINSLETLLDSMPHVNNMTPMIMQEYLDLIRSFVELAKTQANGMQGHIGVLQDIIEAYQKNEEEGG